MQKKSIADFVASLEDRQGKEVDLDDEIGEEILTAIREGKRGALTRALRNLARAAAGSK